MTNSFKYAFPKIGDVKKGVSEYQIQVALNLDSDNTRALIVNDNSIGLPENLVFRNSSTLGLHLVSVLTQQLKGSIELDKTKGTKFKVTFPI